MRKFIKSFLIIAAMVLLINVSQVSAADEVVAIDGASIRVKTETEGQGLRFYAKLSEEYKENEHGFYLVYGKATVVELENAIVEAGSGPITLNGKEVFHVTVPGVTNDNEFSVVLLDIPEVGYLDNISAIPYVVVGEQTIFPENIVTRSVGEVALNMANANHETIEDILTVIKDDFKRVGFNAFADLEITDSLFELNHFVLRDIFIRDWNEMFNTTWTILDAGVFHASAKEGITEELNANKDITNSNIYKFFNHEVYGDKWQWLLDLIIPLGSGIVHPARQAEAIKGNGINEAGLWQTLHLSYSITNFFNGDEQVGGYNAVKFVNKANYNNITFNDKIYVDINNYEYFKIGDSYVIPEAEVKEGYDFLHYKDGEVEVDAGLYTITEDNRLFSKVYEAINYDVFFFDGDLELTTINTTYTIENALTLPTPEIEGKIFEGWYDNALLSGDVVTTIGKGSTGAKTYYGKFVETLNVPVEVTYNLNGGRLTAEQMIEYREATKIIATRYSAAGDNPGHNITIGPSRGGLYWYVMGFKETATEGVYELVGKDTAYSNEEATLYISYHDAVTDPDAAVIKNMYGSIAVGDLVVVPWLPSQVTGSTSVDMHFMNSSALTDDVVVTMINEEPLMVLAGENFLGWYDNAEFTGSAIVNFPGYEQEDNITSVTYYARWE